jgi:hydroxymethylpyrimidine kinase/phosphomethylpyrimidine kinase
MISILSIAGSDSGGGAGIQADIKTIHRMGAHALTAVTAVTVQNSLGVRAVHPVPADIIAGQVEAVVSDAFPAAVKIGMLKTGGSVRAVAELIKRLSLENVVLDPVLSASAGGRLLEPDALDALREELIPRVRAVTPNLAEASAITGLPVESAGDAREAALALRRLGPEAVVTGGHLPGGCVDTVCDDEGVHSYSGARLDTDSTHGSGCVFSTALAVALGTGAGFRQAVIRARRVTRGALRHGYRWGEGTGAVDPLWGCFRGLRLRAAGSLLQTTGKRPRPARDPAVFRNGGS